MAGKNQNLPVVTLRDRREAKSDTTTRVAQEIMDAERAAREAKSERLRLARLALQSGGSAAAPAAVSKGHSTAGSRAAGRARSGAPRS